MNSQRRFEHDDEVDSIHDPDPMWDLEDMDEEPNGTPGTRRVPLWVIVIAVLIALALLIQLGWPLVMDFIDRNQDSGGFPTPGPV
jgi:hypothetical protein